MELLLHASQDIAKQLRGVDVSTPRQAMPMLPRVNSDQPLDLRRSGSFINLGEQERPQMDFLLEELEKEKQNWDEETSHYLSQELWTTLEKALHWQLRVPGPAPL